MPQTLARHLVETGKLRVGHQVAIKSGKNAGKPRPEYLTKFRLTSNSREALLLAADKYGGEVRAWSLPPAWRDHTREPGHRWELYTNTDTLDVMIRADSLMSTSFERWQGNVCTLRCDGQFIIKDGQGKLVGHECICPSDPDERKALAARRPPEACWDVSRIVVLLEGLPVGQWRLDTRGFYAPAETRGLQDLLRVCKIDTMMVPARMRVEERNESKMKQGEHLNFRYVCVVIEPQHTMTELLVAGAHQRMLLPPGIEAEQKSLTQHIEDLYGPPPPDERLLGMVAELEAAIAHQGGSFAEWEAWIVALLEKPRTAFTVEDYTRWLEAVRKVEQRGPRQKDAPEIPESATRRGQGSTNAPGKVGRDPESRVSDAGRQNAPMDDASVPEGPRPDLSGPGLFNDDEMGR